MARSLAITAVLAAAIPAARADNALRPERIPNKARELADKGRAYHRAGKYESAIAAFKEAYVLAPSPSLLFNIAQSYRLAGNCDESAWMYRRFLDTSPVGEHRRLAEMHLDTVEKCGTGGLRVTPIVVKRDDAEIPVPEPELQVDAVPVSDERSRTFKKVGIGAAVGGGALLAGAAIFAIDSADAAKTVEETYKRGGKWSEIADADRRGRRSATIASALGIGGGLAVATGVVFYALGRHYEPARHVAVTPTATGAQVSLSWGF